MLLSTVVLAALLSFGSAQQMKFTCDQIDFIMNDLFTYRVPTNEDQSLIVTCSLKCVDASGESTEVDYPCCDNQTAKRVDGPGMFEVTCEPIRPAVSQTLAVPQPSAVPQTSAVPQPSAVPQASAVPQPSAVPTDPNGCPAIESDDSKLERCDSSQRPKSSYIDAAKDKICAVRCFTQRSSNGGSFGPKTPRTRYACQDGLVNVRAYPGTSNFKLNCVESILTPTTTTTTVVPVATTTPPPLQPCPPLETDVSKVPNCFPDHFFQSKSIDRNEICRSNCYTRRAFAGNPFGPRRLRTNRYSCRPGMEPKRVGRKIDCVWKPSP